MDIKALPFSQTRRVGGLVFVSGQIGIRDGALVPGGIRREFAQAILNLESEIGGRGALATIIDITAFLVDESDYLAFNDEYSKVFKQPFPTRTTVIVRALPLSARVELKAIAESK